MGEASDLALFIGRFHPVLVHLPIGILLFAVLLECAARFPGRRHLSDTVPFALLLGALGGVAAGITGYLLSGAGGYGEQLVAWHKWLGISLTLLAFTAWLLRTRYPEPGPRLRRVYGTVLALLAAAVLATGHYGGSLTHGADYLFRYMPGPLASLLNVQPADEEEIPLLEDLDSAQVYVDVIEPILRTRCASCHNADRREGELLMTSHARLMAGGESGPAIAAAAGESELYRRLHLPAADEERMPPRGRRQLTADQVALIGWWIDLGAPAEGQVSALESPGRIAGILQNLTVEGRGFFARTAVPPADPALLEALRERGVTVSPVAEGMNFLQVRFPPGSEAGRMELEMLLPLAEQLTWLNLAGSGLSDEELTPLDRLFHLTRLDLRGTAAGDRTLERLSGMEHLEYLNLYGTAVTGNGVRHLEKLSSLRSLYLSGTGVDGEAVAELQVRLPGAEIVGGPAFLQEGSSE